MPAKISKRLLSGLVVAAAAALFLLTSMMSASPVFAVPPDSNPDIFDPGIACSFGLQIDYSGGHRVDREFTDKNGNTVRILSAGKGFLETFTNLSTGATVTYKTGGSVSQIIVNLDGSLTFVATGHNVIILFPEDEPAGPSTILYLGRFVATVDPVTFVGTVEEITGTQIDISAALS
jgi:hypothetical protein